MKQDNEENPEKDNFRSLLGQALNRSRQAAREGMRRADEVITESAERAGVSEQLDSARRNLQRSGEVLTGADIHQFDDFTDAVTRVLIGMHRDQAAMARRLTLLENVVKEILILNPELVERLATIEQTATSQFLSEDEG